MLSTHMIRRSLQYQQRLTHFRQAFFAQQNYVKDYNKRKPKPSDDLGDKDQQHVLQLTQQAMNGEPSIMRTVVAN